MIAFDTSVLIYVVDTLDRERHEAAVEIVGGAMRRQEVVFLLQSFAEFFRVSIRKFRLAPAAARGFIDTWRAAAHKLSFFDALLWATAERAGVPYLVTEDQQDGRRLGRVTFLQPFAVQNRAILGLD